MSEATKEEYLEKLLTSPDLWEDSDTESLLQVGKKLQEELHELVNSLFEDFSKKPTRRRESRIFNRKLRLERLAQDIPFLMDVLEELCEASPHT